MRTLHLKVDEDSRINLSDTKSDQRVTVPMETTPESSTGRPRGKSARQPHCHPEPPPIVTPTACRGTSAQTFPGARSPAQDDVPVTGQRGRTPAHGEGRPEILRQARNDKKALTFHSGRRQVMGSHGWRPPEHWTHAHHEARRIRVPCVCASGSASPVAPGAVSTNSYGSSPRSST